MQTYTKTISALIATIAIIGAGQLFMPNFKKKIDPICSLRKEEIHISKHEASQYNKNSLKIKVETICRKKQIETTIETNMFELIDGHEHLVMPFRTVRKHSNTGSLTFYFKNIYRECLNKRHAKYVAHLTAHIKLRDQRMITLTEESKPSQQLTCSFY